MKHSLKIISEEVRRRAIDILRNLPLDPCHTVKISEYKKNRNLEQNAKMWAILTDISEQVTWHNTKLTKDEWKDVITAAVKRQKVVIGIDGGFVVIGGYRVRPCFWLST